MPIDYKIAKHICNVVRRQVQSSFPDLYMEFILHEKGKRYEVFSKEKKVIEDHPAGHHLIKYTKTAEACNILKKNKTQFFAISYQNNSGFMGFFKNSNYLALCFINYEDFESEDNLRNHAFNIAWHAINLYSSYINDGDSKDDIICKNNILAHITSKKQLYHNNLVADIFSTSAQLLQGRKDALEIMAKQRIYEALIPKIGLFAERFPFPVSIDTLDFMFDSSIDQYKNSKKPVIAALNIAKKTGEAFDESSIKQWYGFSLPAQEMAWAGYSPNIILGAALYSSENAYVQSIADMIADKMKIKPEIVTSLQDYNPFADNQTNESVHKRQCSELINSLLDKVAVSRDYNILMDIAKKQNQVLLEKSPMGWCAGALIAAANIIKENPDKEDILKEAKSIFNKEVEALPWGVLADFARVKFQHRRSGVVCNMSDVAQLAKSDDKFILIYQALHFTERL